MLEFNLAPDIHQRITKILQKITFEHIKPEKLVCFRSRGSKARAKARIWSLPRIWQQALKVEPHYCIEVLAEKFDQLSEVDKTKVLIHELLHIPKTFSGALLPHRGRGRVRIDEQRVNQLYKELVSRKRSSR